MARPKGIPLHAFQIFLLAGLIGALGGFLGAGFQRGVHEIQALLIGSGGRLAEQVEALPAWKTLLLPTAGGLLAGLVLWTIKNQRHPFGIADIIGLVYLRKGILRVRESLVQIVSSACTIGSGGSIGREGANSQIAATLASALTRFSGTSSRTRAVLLGCGVAAGMACSYNAPIAAAIFVMEAVLGNFAMDVFAPVVVASVLSTIVRKQVLLDEPIYGVQLTSVLDEKLILSALVLGAVCGVGGILFRRVLKLGQRLFSAIPAPLMARMALGGLVVGVIGLVSPETWGNGYDAIQKIAVYVEDPELNFGAMAVSAVFALVVLKVVATASTAGSGGLGGVFTPNLVVGAALGAFFAYGLQGVWPSVAETAQQAREEQIIFTLVGMAGLVAATMHTPITAVVLVFELTRHYDLILPVMLCSITASIVARLLDEDSYYSEKLKARGEEMPSGLEELAIKTTYVRDVMRTDPVSVKDTASFDEVMELLANTRRDMLYVVDNRNVLLGHIQLHDVKNFINDPTLGSVVIAGDLTHPAAATTAEKSLASVMVQFDDPELAELAVITDGAEPQLVGRLTRRDVIATVRDEVLGQRKLRARFRRHEGDRSTFVELPPNYEIGRVQVPEEWTGRAFDSLDLYSKTKVTPLLVISTDESGQEVRNPPSPEFVLDASMSLIVIGPADAIERFGKEPEAPEES